jgi:hypothetical protein
VTRAGKITLVARTGVFIGFGSLTNDPPVEASERMAKAEASV